jgi:hypothetical protein
VAKDPPEDVVRRMMMMMLLLLFIAVVPNTKLCAWGEEESGENDVDLRVQQVEQRGRGHDASFGGPLPQPLGNFSF